MRYLLVVICLLRAWRDANSTKVTRYEGGGVSISCNYSEDGPHKDEPPCKGLDSKKPTKPPTTTIKGTTISAVISASAEPSGTTSRMTTSAGTLLPITVGLTVVLLLLGLTLLIFYKPKRKKPGASKPLSDRTDTDTRHPDTIQCSSEYEEIKDQIAVVPSLYCTADLPENASPMTVYFTVSRPKASCSDSIIFTENPACTNNSAINFMKDSEYATVNL